MEYLKTVAMLFVIFATVIASIVIGVIIPIAYVLGIIDSPHIFDI